MKLPWGFTKSKLLGLIIFAYGFVVFADEATSELIDQGLVFKGNAVIKSSLILGSYWGWPGSGVAASYGVAMALFGFCLLRLRTPPSDVDFYEDYVRPALNSMFDAATLFCGWCLAWTLLLSVFQPGAMTEQVTEYLYGSGITNTFVMYASAIAVASLMVLRYRSRLFGWVPPLPSGRRFTAAVGLGCLCGGIAIIVVLLNYFNPFLWLTLSTAGLVCSPGCQAELTLDLVGWVSGCIFVLLGLIISVEELLPRESPLW